MTFYILSIKVPSSLLNVYDLVAPTRTIVYGPSQFGWNLPSAGLAVFSKILLKTRSPSWNVRGFTCLLYRFANLCWYDTIRTTAASRSSSAISRSLVTASALAFSGILVQSVVIPISVGIIASIPYIRANGDIDESKTHLFLSPFLKYISSLKVQFNVKLWSFHLDLCFVGN